MAFDLIHNLDFMNSYNCFSPLSCKLGKVLLPSHSLCPKNVKTVVWKQILNLIYLFYYYLILLLTSGALKLFESLIVELWCSCTSVLVLLRVFSNSSKIPAISGQQINHIWREISFSIKCFVEMFRLLQCYLAQGLLTVIYLNQIYAVWALHIFEGCLPDNSSFKFPGNKILLYWLYVSR